MASIRSRTLYAVVSKLYLFLSTQFSVFIRSNPNSNFFFFSHCSLLFIHTTIYQFKSRCCHFQMLFWIRWLFLLSFLSRSNAFIFHELKLGLWSVKYINSVLVFGIYFSTDPVVSILKVCFWWSGSPKWLYLTMKNWGQLWGPSWNQNSDVGSKTWIFPDNSQKTSAQIVKVRKF